MATPKNPRSPPVTKALRYLLIAVGASLVISGLVNIAAAWRLIEPAEEQSLGITRNEVIGWLAVMLAIGVALIWIGLRRRK